MPCRLGILIAIAMGASGPALAQPANPIGIGSASISGRVVDRMTERPLRGVLITLHTASLKGSLVTETDGDGRYAFDGIAAGDYRLMAQHPEYVDQLFGVPETNDFRFATSTGIVRVERKQLRANVDFSLVRGALLAGRITSHDGRLLKDANVTLQSVSTTSGNRLMGSGGSARTNDNGMYEIRNVPEGSYVVLAQWIDRELVKAGAPLTYSPTYFPGTQQRDQATALKVAPGDSHRNIDIALVASEMLRLSGHVVRGTSHNRIQAYLLSTGTSVRTVSVDEDGAFTVVQLKPGRYMLVARADGDSGPEAAWMSVELTSDMTGVQLGLTTTSRVAGRVVAADRSAVPEGIHVAAILAEQGKEVDPLPRDRVEVGQDGTFELDGLFGERVLRVIGLGADWDVDRIYVGKSTITSLTFQPSQLIDGVVIVLTRR